MATMKAAVTPKRAVFTRDMLASVFFLRLPLHLRVPRSWNPSTVAEVLDKPGSDAAVRGRRCAWKRSRCQEAAEEGGKVTTASADS